MRRPRCDTSRVRNYNPTRRKKKKRKKNRRILRTKTQNAFLPLCISPSSFLICQI
ncbi:hypothetical protein PUN28_006756 [Cardiocondyla obscurior]|uniref:Uncharacterized protein n=1 Tax=Cardiocondyla obscurior TaxID=286306 RepID=A0AAW2FZT7_9HYME